MDTRNTMLVRRPQERGSLLLLLEERSGDLEEERIPGKPCNPLPY